MPTKPKGSGVPFGSKAIAWFCTNQEATVADIEKFMEDHNRSENVTNAWVKKLGQVQKELGIEVAEPKADPKAKASKAPAKGKGKGKSKK